MPTEKQVTISARYKDPRAASRNLNERFEKISSQAYVARGEANVARFAPLRSILSGVDAARLDLDEARKRSVDPY